MRCLVVLDSSLFVFAAFLCIHWLIDLIWLIDWLIDWLINWLIDWLIHSFIDWLRFPEVVEPQLERHKWESGIRHGQRLICCKVLFCVCCSLFSACWWCLCRTSTSRTTCFCATYQCVEFTSSPPSNCFALSCCASSKNSASSPSFSLSW